MLLNFQISTDDINILTDTFDLDSNVLMTEIYLLKQLLNYLMEKKN